MPTDELRRRFDESDVEIQHGETAQLAPLRDTLAAWWNGKWQRPAWWVDWQQATHPGLSTYRFGPPGGEPTAVLSVAGGRHPVEGRRLVVHDFWAADYSTASAMFVFLGRHNSRIPTVAFQRTGLPPGPLLLHQLHRSGAAAARSWHPWMVRVLDLGGYRSAASAALAGVDGDPASTAPRTVFPSTATATTRWSSGTAPAGVLSQLGGGGGRAADQHPPSAGAGLRPGHTAPRAQHREGPAARELLTLVYHLLRDAHIRALGQASA